MILLTDNSIACPFVVNEEIVSLSLEITSKHVKDWDKHFAIFDWMEKNISYDLDSSLLASNGIYHVYKTSLETFYTKAGNCAEMAFLYIVMARSASLESRFVTVDIDHRGEEVCHACANSLGRLIDPAYHKFEASHQKYNVLNDLEASKLFSEINGGYL